MALIHIPWSTGLISVLGVTPNGIISPWMPMAATLAGLKLMAVWYGQASHRFAHDPKISQKPFWKTLQSAGLMISVKDHKAHHQPPHEVDYCLIGMMNPAIDALRTHVTTDRHAWLGFFLFLCVFDIALLAAGCNAVLSLLS